jgi:CRP-like cAMP-binding protein
MDLSNLFDESSDIDSFREGEVIFAAGEPAAMMYVVIEGEVEIRAGDRLLERAGPGSPVGEMALIRDHVRTATAIAATDCRLAAIDEKCFLFLVQQAPFFALHIMRVLVDRILRHEAAGR